jgi:hypothetical protein
MIVEHFSMNSCFFPWPCQISRGYPPINKNGYGSHGPFSMIYLFKTVIFHSSAAFSEGISIKSHENPMKYMSIPIMVD